MVDPFVLLAAVLLLAVIALLRFVGCASILGVDDVGYSAVTLAITSLDPDHATVGATNVTLTVNGTKFVDNSGTVKRSQVQWNGVSQPATQFVDSTKLTLKIDSLIQTAGKAQITVFNPRDVNDAKSQDATSNEVDFTVNNPQPQITGFDPPDATAQDLAFQLTVKGSNFVPGLTVQLDNDAPFTPPPGSVTASAIKFQMPAAKVLNPGSVTVKVTNLDPSEGPGSATFTIFPLVTVSFPGPGPNDHTPPGSTLNSDASQGWAWEPSTSDDPSPHIFFAAGGLSGKFTFPGTGRLLKSIGVSSNTLGGTVTVTDDNSININNKQILNIPAGIQGQQLTLTINWPITWKLKSKTVTVTFPNPNSFSIHEIKYQGPV